MSESKDFYIGLGVGVGLGIGVSLLSNYLYSSLIVDALLARFSHTLKIDEKNDHLDKARAILDGNNKA
jgi:hypothetical protein